VSASAVAAAVAVAHANGLHADDPVVLRDAWHVLVHLRPQSIVARVSTSLPYPEGPDPQGVVRELAVADHCARAGCAVVPPADEVEAVPYRHGGHIVTFWRYVEPHEEPDGHEAVRALRGIHEALAGYDGELPAFGHPLETEAMLNVLPPSDGVELLQGIAARRPEVEGQALHGDAHRFNCLGSPRGPLWHDFETACHGPREYDLAALKGDAALAAYGPYDNDLLEAMFPLYLAWVTASMMIAQSRRPELVEAVERRLRDLRHYRNP
jgi:hypothetical protein